MQKTDNGGNAFEVSSLLPETWEKVRKLRMEHADLYNLTQDEFQALVERTITVNRDMWYGMNNGFETRHRSVQFGHIRIRRTRDGGAVTLDKITGLEIAKLGLGYITPEIGRDERPRLVFGKSGRFFIGGTELENTLRMADWCLTVNSTVIADWLLGELQPDGGRYGEWDVRANMDGSDKNSKQITLRITKNDLRESVWRQTGRETGEQAGPADGADAD